MNIKKFAVILVLVPLFAIGAYGKPPRKTFFAVYWTDGQQTFNWVVPHIQFVQNNVSLTGFTTSGERVTVSGKVSTGIITFPDPVTGQPIYVSGNYLIHKN